MNTATPQILIVDNDADMQIFLSNLLEANGFKPVLAEHGNSNLKQALTRIPEIVILDVPVSENHWLLVHHYLEQNDIPVIMISTLERKTFMQYQRSLSTFKHKKMLTPDAYLKKPLETDEFLITVNRIIGNPIHVP